MDENITPVVLPETEQNVPAAAGDGAGSNTEAVLTAKDFVKQVLGKEFKTDEEAIKSLKETQSYVGSMGQKVKTLEQQLAQQTPSPDVLAKLTSFEKTLQDQGFYMAHPEYNTPSTKALITKFGGSPEEVVKDEVFQTAFKAIQTTSEMEQSKSVLHSNPRLGQAQDKLTQANEALKNNQSEAAADAATAAVMEAYDLK